MSEAERRAAVDALPGRVPYSELMSMVDELTRQLESKSHVCDEETRRREEAERKVAELQRALDEANRRRGT